MGPRLQCTMESETRQQALRNDLVTRRLLSRGAVCANAHAYVMYAAFFVRPGALGSPQRRKISGTSVKIISGNEGDRDGKSAKSKKLPIVQL